MKPHIGRLLIVGLFVAVLITAVRACGQQQGPDPAKSHIVVFREHKALWARGVKFGVEVDNFPVAVLPQARYVTVDVAPGKHIVESSSASLLRRSVVAPVGLILSPGETAYVRMYALRSGAFGLPQVRLSRVDEQEAKQWLEHCQPAERGSNENGDLDLSKLGYFCGMMYLSVC